MIGAFIVVGCVEVGTATYIHAKAWTAQRLIARAWSRTLNGEREVQPWPWADSWPVARLRVPETNTKLYVLSNATGRTLAFGPGVLSGRASPGESGNTIISAHRDTHFRFLRDVSDNAELELQTRDGHWHRYVLNERFVLDIRRDRLLVEGGGSTLTLMTCYPFDSIIPGGPLRYAVVARSRVSE